MSRSSAGTIGLAAASALTMAHAAALAWALGTGPAFAAVTLPIDDGRSADIFEACLLDGGSTHGPTPNFEVMCCTGHYCVFCLEEKADGTFTDCYVTGQGPHAQPQAPRPGLAGGLLLAPLNPN